MISENLLNEINAAYSQLETRMIAVYGSLYHRMFELECGWYNGHYSLGEDGEWNRDSYPIPVVSVKGLCDVEVSFTGITLTTKMRRTQAIEYSFVKFANYDFEAYGVADYLNNYRSKGESIEEFKKNLKGTKEREIFITFTIPEDMIGDKLYNFAKLLKREGFYY